MPDQMHRICGYGPGGYKCPCCGPAPKHRKKERRRVKRKLRQMTQKEIEEESDASKEV